METECQHNRRKQADMYSIQESYELRAQSYNSYRGQYICTAQATVTHGAKKHLQCWRYAIATCAGAM